MDALVAIAHTDFKKIKKRPNLHILPYDTTQNTVKIKMVPFVQWYHLIGRAERDYSRTTDTVFNVS